MEEKDLLALDESLVYVENICAQLLIYVGRPNRKKLMDSLENVQTGIEKLKAENKKRGPKTPKKNS